MTKGTLASSLGGVALLLLVFASASDVSAQPTAAQTKTTASKVSDAGADATSTSTDAGVADASTNLANGDASVSTASTSDVASTSLPPRKMFPPPPPPSAAQVAALSALKEEVDAYEKGAKAYRDTVTSIVRLHYEAKKQEVLAGLDGEIAYEKGELKKARQTAIQRLEEFVATYSGSRSQPEATPDAMYRLAALYEERARGEDVTEPLEIGLKPALALYKRVIREYPNYRELAGIYYFLGHALNDSGRTDEAQQVWRSLVCHNHYEYPTPVDPKDPEKDTIKPMPQDHDEAFWQAWRNKYRDPKSISRKNPDTVYVDPFPANCASIPQPTVARDEEPKYVAEVWWQIGNWEFDQLDFASGVTREDPASVWGYNRAASAYTQSMKYKRPPLYGVALYKYAWTLFKQQRYEATTKEFVRLLNYTDEQEKLTGDPGADFRSEAYTYIAGSLTNVDFKGPEDWEPFIQRPDILDTEPNPDRAEQKLHVAIDRVQDASLIPQDKSWTIQIYRALALEYRSLNQFKNAVEVYSMMLKRWPMDPSAPESQNAIAETYDQLNMQQRPGTPEHDAIAKKALEARTALANYIGDTPWTRANKDNPTAIQNAERLVRGGLRQAAAQHTNNGQAALVAANDTTDPARQIELLSRAATEYKLAGIGWYGYLKQDENAPDAYESRYWLADGRRQYVRIQVVLHKVSPNQYPEPGKQDINDALVAAQDVRDSNEDDKYLDNAAFFVVDVSDVDRDLAYQRFEDTKGASGVEHRTEVKFDSEDAATRKVVRENIPAVVQQSITARDEYVQIVPPNLDKQHHAGDYQFYAAETYFLYGQFDIARQRFEPMWKEHCGKDTLGYQAWEKLITMSNLERDVDRSTQLAEAEKTHSCAFSDEDKVKAGLIVNPTLQEAAFVNARKKFEEAQKAPPGPEKNKLWREAAALYETALAEAPGRDEAPEAAMNAAYAYKQVGEYNKAIELYNKFISEYGSEARLSALEKGDPKTKAAPDPKRYKERLGYLGDAYDALATTYYSFFNYQRAAETNEKVASNARFDEKKRRDAAKNAMILYSNMGQRDKMLAEHAIFVKLNPPGNERADADYLVASFDYKQWQPNAADSGTNRQTRFQAEAALKTYYDKNRGGADSAKYVVEAAYAIGKMKRVGNESDWRTWFKNTVSAWDNYRAKAPVTKDNRSEAQLPPYVDYAAEADYTLIAEQVTDQFDRPEKHKYSGTVADILGTTDANGKITKPGKYQTNAKEAEKWDLALEKIAKTYESLEWVPTAIARQGAVYDTLRTGLYNTVKVTYFTKQEEKLLDTMRNSGRDDLMNKADALEDAKKEFWRSKKEQELGGADEVMVRKYATAVSLAQAYNVRNQEVTRAIGRLAYFTDIIGDAKMGQYVTNTPDPTNKGATKLPYRPGQYVQTRPGLAVLPPPKGSSSPLPAAP